MTTEQRDSGNSTHHQTGVTDELRHDADRLKDTVGARAKEEAESRKGQAVHVAGSASSALNTAAEDLRRNPEVPDWMAAALQQAARNIETLASHIGGRNVDQLGEDLSQFARRSPGTFLAASAAAGFAAARVLRAGVDKKRHGRDGRQQHAQAEAPGSGQASGWPADENIKPTETGGATPAYGVSQSGMGGTSQ